VSAGESRHAGDPRTPGRSRPFGVLLQIAYSGTGFRGWASQREGRTVQAEVLGAIRAIDPRAGSPHGTSRTDAGVHAEGQIATFDATLDIPPRGWVLALNQHLPDDVSVRRAWRTPPDLRPSAVVVAKRYVYRLLLDRVRDPLWKDRAWRTGWRIDLTKLAREGASLVGTHDFGAFRSSHDARTHTVRTIRRFEVVFPPPEAPGGSDPRVVAIIIEGNAFLYNMVRIAVGTLMDIARGKLEEGTVARAFETRDRKTLGTTAPAHGLTLEHVDMVLPEEVSAPWPP
jgi:tRNA pseudouridine38-40 synthase